MLLGRQQAQLQAQQSGRRASSSKAEAVRQAAALMAATGSLKTMQLSLTRIGGTAGTPCCSAGGGSGRRGALRLHTLEVAMAKLATWQRRRSG